MSHEIAHEDALAPRGTAPVEFLRTHRAVAACARELEALSDALVDAVDNWYATGLAHKPATRRSPGRCAIQLGPVALTCAWLRSPQDDVTAGELLMIVWHGIVGPRRDHEFERVARAAIPLTATQVWEQVFKAGTVGVDTWQWRPAVDRELGFSAAELAAHGVERLQAAYLLHCPPDVDTVTPLPRAS